jgi:hypothetical protein
MKDLILITVAILMSLTIIDSIKEYNKVNLQYQQTMQELMKHPNHVYDNDVDEYCKDMSNEELVEILGL